ncbi:MAG: GNAT family N-acetyltransferase [Clostridia bacterium]|nr:GNAT family N-acetyltransferase [Clostridia bacterium]
MSQTEIIKKYRAAELPDEWDKVTKGNVYLRREFLGFIENSEKDYNPEYYLFYDGGRLDSVFVAHERRDYNLGMFTKIDIKIKVKLVYLPMCVTASSMVVGKLKDLVFDTIRSIRGYKMILNLTETDLPGFANGLTCPKCILNLDFTSFDDYLSSLRSDYRNRAKKILRRTESLNIRFIDNKTEFTDELYSLYLNVLSRSRVRIETLSKEYFTQKDFRIFVCYENEKPAGFCQLLPDGDELIFEFVGVDYEYNDIMPVYHRMLLEIIRYGIENGFKTIDFGQTADDTKLKLGSRYVRLYAALHSSNPIINFICRLLAKKIEYKPVTTEFRVFKERGK